MFSQLLKHCHYYHTNTRDPEDFATYPYFKGNFTRFYTILPRFKGFLGIFLIDIPNLI